MHNNILQYSPYSSGGSGSGDNWYKLAERTSKTVLPRIIVSMTTIPSRIDHIEHTLKSLLVDQSMPVDQLYIVLPQKNWIGKAKQDEQPIEYNIPDFLQDLIQQDERLIILHPQYDYGPVDKMLYALEKESLITHGNNTNLIYVDDDVTYDSNLVRTLVRKGIQYPDSVVAFSGCNLRSHFRQIKHKFPRSLYDRHPNLYYATSGTQSLPEDEIVDVVQGFTGVLIRPHFFNFEEFLSLVENVTDRQHENLIWKSDDYIISGYLEQQNVTRRIVLGGVLPNVNENAATIDNLSRKMHRQVMLAAYDLQHRLNIWRNFAFVNYMSLSSQQKDLVDCEAGYLSYCKKITRDGKEHINTLADATKILDKLLL